MKNCKHLPKKNIKLEKIPLWECTPNNHRLAFRTYQVCLPAGITRQPNDIIGGDTGSNPTNL
jgi:hypothetical protein